MQRAAAKETSGQSIFGRRLQQLAALMSVWLLCVVPLTFLTILHRFYTLPRFVLLLTGSSILAAILALLITYLRREERTSVNTRQLTLVSLYVLWVAGSTIFGVAPLVSLMGSFENQMGLLTHLCFFVCYLGLIAGVTRSTAGLEMVLWTMALTGLVVAAYGVAQFFGIDPFVPPSLYTFKSDGNSLVRVPSTIGHADYLGNFLLYVVWIAFALSLVSSGSARRIAIAASLLIATAIVCSGTRGAWVGLVSGAITFAFFEGRRAAKDSLTKKRLLPVAATAFLLVIAFCLLVATNPASRNIVLRAKSFAGDGLTGSGRTLLWRDSVKMIPAFSIRGSGPEGFRKAFLAYKSKELAQLSPQTNNESSHNSYLDVAISYGLPGLALYLALIASTFHLLLGVYRRTTRNDLRIIVAGLMASYAGVIIHNIFIFDQIPTGLYFFALAALAQIASSISKREIASDPAYPPVKTASGHWRLRATAGAGLALIGSAAWYSAGLIRADIAIKRAFVSADAGNLEKTIGLGERATAEADPTRAYDFLFAQALTVCVDRLRPDSPVPKEPRDESGSMTAARDKALRLATAHAKETLAVTLTPDSNYLLLAYISALAGRAEDLEAFAAKAVESDPTFSNARWLMAKAYLARGLSDEAAREARIGLELNPYSRELALVLKEARRAALPKEDLIKRYIRRAGAAADRGNMKKAERMIARAVRLSKDSCQACHRSLALFYEKASRYDEAIAEWKMYIKESSSTVPEEIALSLKELMQKRADSSKTARQNAP